MEMSCVHTHTSFCDGKGEIDDFCRAALEKGFKSLGFSAHAPITKKTGIKSDWHLKDERLDEYIEAVTGAKKRWQGKLEIYLGLEVDYIPNLIAPWDISFKSLCLDYTIASVHYIVPERGAPFAVDGSVEELVMGLKEGFNGDRQALVNFFWDLTETMIRGGGFDILGHVDLIRKNNNDGWLFDEGDDHYRRRCKGIAETASLHGTVVELNTGGMNRRRMTEPYPSLQFIKNLQSNNVPIIINADAHSPSELDGCYGNALTFLKTAGYKETLLFDGRKNDAPQWRKVEII